MYCTNCGSSIPDDSVFCPSCGVKIKEQSSSNTSFSIVENSNYNQPDDIEKDDKSHFKDEAGFLGVLLSIIWPLIGIIMYFVTRKTRRNANYYLIAAIISAIFFSFIRMAMKH